MDNPSNDVRDALATGCAYRLREFRSAKALFRTAIELGVPEAHLNLGLTLVRLGRDRDAISHLLDAWRVSATTDCAQALARAYAATAQDESALEWYARATDADDAVLEASELIESAHDSDRALQYLGERAPGRSVLLVRLGVELVQLHRYPEAEVALRSALSSGDGTAAVPLAGVLEQCGDEAAARDVLRQGVRLDDRNSANNLALYLWADGQRPEAAELWRSAARRGDRVAKRNLKRRGLTVRRPTSG